MGTRLSSPMENLKKHYTAVVVGSGYGGGIAASRLARAGQQVCLLERGREFQPGEYPDTEVEAVAQIQANTPEARIGSPTGLYDFHVNQDINVLVGCGLGGTSLINANVSLRADSRVLSDPRWPEELRGHPEAVEEGYRRAEDMLKPTPYPAAMPKLAKLQAQETSAAGMGEKCYWLNINVTFQDGVNHVGVHQSTCANCGDCVTGCNYGAKNTTLMNYLPDARNHGAEIYTEAEVAWLRRTGASWEVYFRWLNPDRKKFGGEEMFITADIIVLAAGTLGSTAILLRSKANGLAVSDVLGQRFTGNGDVLGFSYNTKDPVHGVGFGHRHAGEVTPVGPCITAVIDLRNPQQSVQDGMVIEDGSIPGALALALPAAMAAAAAANGVDAPTDLDSSLREKERELESLTLGSYHGALDHTQTYLVMTHDDGQGKLRLEDDRIRIDWPGVGSQPNFQKVDERLRQASHALGGIYVRNPIWTQWLHNSLVTVHPLGGAVMADRSEQGVVNHKGQVFVGGHGTDVYDNLYVADGSIIPIPLGVNPLFTISAIAERTCAMMASDRHWVIDYTLPSLPRPATVPAIGIEFTETMKGFMCLGVLDDYQRGFDQGQRAGSPFSFTLTISSNDLRAMLADPSHEAAMAGTATAPALSASPMTILEGKFNLFTVDPNDPNSRRMLYRMTLQNAEGLRYRFEGFKVVRKNPRTTIWSDTSTLYITIAAGASTTDPVLAKGILHILPEDFAKQLTTMHAVNATTLADQTRALTDFGRFFCGTLFDVYAPIITQHAATESTKRAA